MIYKKITESEKHGIENHFNNTILKPNLKSKIYGFIEDATVSQLNAISELIDELQNE